jgi:nucleoside-diphosphate-sugar epimerase
MCSRAISAIRTAMKGCDAVLHLAALIAIPYSYHSPVIPTIIAQIAAGQRTIKLGSIHPTRDFNYVADTVGGFIAALDRRHDPGHRARVRETTCGRRYSRLASTVGFDPSGNLRLVFSIAQSMRSVRRR